MKLVTRAVVTAAVLAAAAIPVAALTIKNTSSKEVTVGVDTGSEEAVYTVPANGSVDVTQDCSAGCAVTGPWGFSRMVSQNDAIETDGAPLVTVTDASPAPAKSQPLVPQNPGAESASDAANTTAAAPVTATPAAPAKRTARRAKPSKQTAKQAPAGSGSFQMLFQGPKK